MAVVLLLLPDADNILMLALSIVVGGVVYLSCLIVLGIADIKGLTSR